MGIGAKIVDFLGGSVFKEVKDLVTEYLPPDMSEEKRAEFAFRLRELQDRKEMEAAKLQTETLRVELEDTQSARQEHKLSNMPAAITVMLTLIVAGLLVAIIKVDLQPGNREVAIGLFGIVFAQWGAAIQYWVGTTRSSAEKTRALSETEKALRNAP